MENMNHIADNFRDFHRYLNGAVVGSKTDTSQIFRIDSRDDDKVVLKNLATSRVKTVKWQTVLEEYLLHPPKLGWVNVKSYYVFFIQRVPARQWLKGFSLDGATAFKTWCPHRDTLQNNMLYPASKTVHMAAFTNKYTPYSTAVNAIVNGKALGRALSTDYAVIAPPQLDGVGLYYKKQLIGSVDPLSKNIHLTLSTNHFRDDLSRHFPQIEVNTAR